MRNHPRYLEVLWSAWWADLVVVPVNAKLHPAEVAWIVDNAQARWAFVTSDVAPQALPGLERRVDADSPEAADLLAPVALGGGNTPAERRSGDLAWLFCPKNSSYPSAASVVGVAGGVGRPIWPTMRWQM